MIASLESRVDQLAAELTAALVDDDGDPATPPTIDPDEFAKRVARSPRESARGSPRPTRRRRPPLPGRDRSRRHRGDPRPARAAAPADHRGRSPRHIDLDRGLANQISELAGEVDTIGTGEHSEVSAAPVDGSALW